MHNFQRLLKQDMKRFTCNLERVEGE